METVLITGGSGFVAAHLLRELNSDQICVSAIRKIKLVDLKPFVKKLGWSVFVNTKGVSA